MSNYSFVLELLDKIKCGPSDLDKIESWPLDCHHPSHPRPSSPTSYVPIAAPAALLLLDSRPSPALPRLACLAASAAARLLLLVQLFWPPVRPVCHPFLTWTYRVGPEERGPLKSFNIPFFNVGKWDPVAVIPPNDEIIDPEELPIVPPEEPQAIQPLQAIPPYRGPRDLSKYDPEDLAEEMEEGDP
ncbi:hypothetical protein NL676_014367 [Syzygium grande]|nr:hypothetical protein NL676_014367 [Syzygium grande]